MRDSLKIMANWLEDCKDMPAEQRKEIYFMMVEYGIYGNETEISDPAVKMGFNFIKRQIDNMQTTYDERKEYGKKIGRKLTYDNALVYQMARSGMTAKTISEELNVPYNTIYSSEGWKKRKVEGLYKNVEININCENIFKDCENQTHNCENVFKDCENVSTILKETLVEAPRTKFDF